MTQGRRGRETGFARMNVAAVFRRQPRQVEEIDGGLVLRKHFLRDLCQIKSQGIVFPAAGAASMFSFQSPEGFGELLKARRVALIDGPTDMPFSNVPDTLIDLVTVNWQAVAECIANDMVTLEAFDQNRRTTFEGQAHLRVPLSSFSEPLRPLRSLASL